MIDNDEILQNLIKRVYHLEQEVKRLGGEPYKQEEEVETPVVMVAPVEPIPPVAPIVEEIEEIKVAEAEEISEPVNPMPEQHAEQPHYEAPKKQNVENKIGKNGMAILASILIFFSLVLFAGIAFSYLSDIAKVAIMYAISIAIAAFGIVKMPKKNKDKDMRFKTFYTTLAACGIGAVYITDLVAYFGFKCMPLAAFVISLVGWIAATMVLAYLCSPIFVYISNIGLIIATVLSAVQFKSSLVAFILYTICLIALYMISRSKSFNRDSYYFIQYPVVFMILSCAVETSALSYTVFTVLLMAVFVIANILYKVDINQIPANIIVVLLNIGALIRMCFGMDGNVMKYVTIGLLIGIMALYFVKYYEDLKLLFYPIFVITYIISVAVFVTTDMYVLIALAPFMLFLALGFVKKDMLIRMSGYFALLVSYLIHMDFYESWYVFVFYFAILVMSVAAGFINYSMVDKYVTTAITCLMFFNIKDVFNLDVSIYFAIFAIVAIITNTRLYRKNAHTDEDEIASIIIGYIINVLMILSGIICSFSKSTTPEIYQVIIIMLITLVLICMNTKSLFATVIPELVSGFYICIKFSLWIYAALHRLNAASYVISIVGILIAITCIVIGFKIRQKSFRLYGLIVSMVSVIKLILFDISYDSNILRPVGFFIAGVLCFAISFIYSKLEKKIY